LGVACSRSPAAAGASPWFTCRCLRSANASVAWIYKRSRWARVPVPSCGRGARFHRTVWTLNGRGGRFCHVGHAMGTAHGFRHWRWLGRGWSA
jgi:hypothetical protein